MAYLFFDSNYAPCSVLIVKDGGDPYNENDTILVQGEETNAVAEFLGFKPRGKKTYNEHGEYSTYHDYDRADNFLRERENTSIALLDEYFG